MSVDEGQTIYFEIKGTGSISSQWFEAEQNSEGAFVLTKKGKRDMETKKQQAKGGGDGGGGDGGGGGGS